MGVSFHFPRPRWARAAPAHAAGQRAVVRPDPHGGTVPKPPREARHGGTRQGTGGTARAALQEHPAVPGHPCSELCKGSACTERARPCLV